VEKRFFHYVGDFDGDEVRSWIEIVLTTLINNTDVTVYCRILVRYYAIDLVNLQGNWIFSVIDAYYKLRSFIF
jgi:hypothetical protein